MVSIGAPDEKCALCKQVISPSNLPRCVHYFHKSTAWIYWATAWIYWATEFVNFIQSEHIRISSPPCNHAISWSINQKSWTERNVHLFQYFELKQWSQRWIQLPVLVLFVISNKTTPHSTWKSMQMWSTVSASILLTFVGLTVGREFISELVNPI